MLSDNITITPIYKKDAFLTGYADPSYLILPQTKCAITLYAFPMGGRLNDLAISDIYAIFSICDKMK
jgi:hypothetical protein